MPRTILLLQVIVALSLFGCSKPENTPDDIASQVSGTYYGDYTFSGGSIEEASVILSRQNDSIVNLTAIIAGKQRYTYPVWVYPDDYGSISFRFERFNELLLGIIDGNEMAYTHNYNSFIGQKP